MQAASASVLLRKQQTTPSSGTKSSKATGSVTLESDEQEPAAVACLAALYGVSTPPEQLSHLQLLHMVMLADMLEISAVAAQAVRHLRAAALQVPGLSDAAKQHMLGLQAWPSCLLDVFPDSPASCHCRTLQPCGLKQQHPAALQAWKLC